jgi:hypothetical protein
VTGIMSSSTPTPQLQTPPPKPPFDLSRAALLLLGALILTGCLISVIVTLRCTVWIIPECQTREWGTVIREWLADTIPVLVAIIMRGGAPPAPPAPRP